MMHFLNGTRLGSFLQTLLYITGVPLPMHHGPGGGGGFGGDRDLRLGAAGGQSGALGFGFTSWTQLGPGGSVSSRLRGFIQDELLGGPAPSSSPAPASATLALAPSYNYSYTKCYGILGCIRMKYPRQRGFELFPQEMNVIRPSVCLYVLEDRRCQPVEPDELSIKRLLLHSPLSSSEGAAGVPTPTPARATSYWLTHGYLENGHRLWLHEMVNELLLAHAQTHTNEEGDGATDGGANVFVIDWGKGAEPPYTQAATNIEIVGAYVGYLMTLLEEGRGLRTASAHFIGHSLGAHLGGVVGTWLIARGYALGRISGMDPAQPYFELFPPDARLDPSDALFVDVIHTDATPLLHGGTLTGLGTQEPCGHVDFYPNAGKDQPGCNDGVVQAIVQEKGSFLYGLRRFFGCNHIRAVEYFMESIRSSCSFRAYACDSFEALEKGECSVHCDDDGDDGAQAAAANETTWTTEVEGSGDASAVSCNRMGFHARKPLNAAATLRSSSTPQFWRTGDGEQVPVKDSVLYYSMTGTRAPYCREHYTLTLALAPGPSNPIPPGISALTLSIVGVAPPQATPVMTSDAAFTFGTQQGQGYLPKTPTPTSTSLKVLQELTVLDDSITDSLTTRLQQQLEHKYTFGGGPELASRATADLPLEIRVRPALSSPLSWLAVALGKQYRLGIDWVELVSVEWGGTLSGAASRPPTRFCPSLTPLPPPFAPTEGVAAPGMVNLADPKSQLVLSASACTRGSPPQPAPPSTSTTSSFIHPIAVNVNELNTSNES